MSEYPVSLCSPAESVVGLLVFVGVMMLLSALYLYVCDQSRRSRCSVRAAARVVSYEKLSIYDNGRFVLSYLVDDKPIEVTLLTSMTDNLYSTGSTIPILYNIEKPEEFCLDSGQHLHGVTRDFVIVGGVLLLIALVTSGVTAILL